MYKKEEYLEINNNEPITQMATSDKEIPDVTTKVQQILKEKGYK